MAVDRQRLEAALPGYEVGDVLGRGAFGVVFAGAHRALGRHVAIKALPANLAGDEALRRRFNAEARLVASLDHPHVVRVFDYVEADDQFLLVMELLRGGSLEDRIGGRGLGLADACAVLLSVATALEYAHTQGILHRDVKPANVMYGAGGLLKLGDFGIAKVLEGTGSMTATGSIMGTPAYMAPEQASGGALGPATDVYAAGTMAYLLLGGRLPFAGGDEMLAQLVRKVNEMPPPLAEVAPAVPGELATVVDRSLARDPADRYGSAEEFGVALAEAATSVLGAGWLTATGIPVLASGALAAADRSAAPITDPAMTVEGLAPAPVPPVPARTPPPPRRRWGLVGAVVAALAAAAIAVVLLSGGDGGDDEPEPDQAAGETTPASTAGSEVAEAIPAPLLARLDRECQDSGVPPGLCGCVVDAVPASGITTDELRAAIDRFVADGALVNGLDPLFAECAAA